MKKKKVIVIIAIVIIVAIIGVALWLCFHNQESNDLPDEGTAELLSQKEWISEDMSPHSVSNFSLGNTANQVYGEISSHINLEHKFIDEIPIYEMYPKDLKKGKMIFFLHGQASRKEEYLNEMINYAEEGFLCVCVDLTAHGERIKKEKIMSLEITTQTGKDLDTLIDYYKTQEYADTDCFAVIGLSQGGSVAYWYTANGKYKPSAIVVGSTTPDYNYFSDDSSIINGQVSDSIWTDEEVQQYISVNNPINHIEKFYDLPIMSGNSFDDTIVSYKGSEAFEKLMKEAGNKSVSFYYFDGVGHNVSEDFMQKVLPFINKYLR